MEIPEVLRVQRVSFGEEKEGGRGQKLGKEVVGVYIDV